MAGRGVTSPKAGTTPKSPTLMTVPGGRPTALVAASTDRGLGEQMVGRLDVPVDDTCTIVKVGERVHDLDGHVQHCAGTHGVA